MGTAQSQPVSLQWRWYYGLPELAPWGLIGLLLILPKANRNWQAWLILIPLGLVMIVWEMPMRLLSMPSAGMEIVGVFIKSLAMALTAVWLLGNRLSDRHPISAIVLTLAIMAAVGGLAYVGTFGLALTVDLVRLAVAYGICVTTLLLGMTLSPLSCRRLYAPKLFMFWLALWTGVGLVGSMLILAVVLMAVEPGNPSIFQMFVVFVAVYSLAVGTILYLINLPFMILAFKSPFYRQRFQNVFRLKNESDWLRKGNAGGTRRYAPPLSTDPTTGPVSADDVVGRWRFYLDAVSKTVALEFKPDGTYAQTIIPNQGGLVECPGGTWRLDGSTVKLTDYTTAQEHSSESRSWWLVDTAGGPALFGGDGSDPESFFLITRGPQPIGLSAAGSQ